MNEAKLDLILTVVSELKGSVDKLEGKVDSLQKDFNDFRKQVTQAFKSLNSRIDVLEKQMFAIGIELKQEIQREISNVRDEINHLENTIMLEQAEKLQGRVRVRELESRVAKLEEKFRLAA